MEKSAAVSQSFLIALSFWIVLGPATLSAQDEVIEVIEVVAEADEDAEAPPGIAVAAAANESKPATTTPPAVTTGAASPPAAAAGANMITVTNIEDKEFKAPQAEFQEGKITVKSDPPQSVTLNELQRVAFVHETKLAAEWIGQINRDLVQVGSVDEGNGIRDIHIRASGLAAKNLTQVAIVSRPQFRVWKKDTARSPYWKIAVDRIGQASVADFYFEPPTRDLFETELELTLTFDDNSTAKTTLKSVSHTSDSAKIESVEGTAAANAYRIASLQLEGGDSLKGRLLQGTANSVVIETAWRPAFEVPLLHLRGIVFDGIKPDVKTKYDEHMAKPDENDLVIVQSKDGGFAEVSGRLQSIGEGGLKILYEEQERSIKLERVQAVIFGAHPATRNWKGPFQVFRMASGDLISAQWVGLSEKGVQLKSAWETDLELPREAVVEVTGRNTKMVNLSEMTPLTVEQVPYFDRIIPWVKDKAWNNRPLRLDDKTYQRGLAVHSRCFLTYDLNAEFSTFRAILGFDEEAGDRGRVVCRVLVDGQELFAKPDFRSGEKAVPVEVSVKGGKQLRLEIDFGEDEDVGDRVIWANARLYRE
jgi:hypothetical protein